MEGIEDLIESMMGSDDSIFGESDIENFLSGGTDNVELSSVGDFGDSLSDEMNQALIEFTNTQIETPNADAIQFTGHPHHSPFDGEPVDNGNSISFEGSGDKYSDNEYNKKAADKWLAKEQDCLAKGDVHGAAAAHSTAMQHLERIKK